MCGGLASRLHKAEFREGVEWLLTKMDASHLHTAMCDGLASRLHKAEFREGVEWLLTKMDASHLHKVMCNGLASRLHKAEFRKGVNALAEHGFPTSKIIMLIGDNTVASKLVRILPQVLKEGSKINRKRAREM